MDFEYSEEQIALQDSLNRYLAKNYSFDKRMSLTKVDLSYSAETWRDFAELGILALPFSEEFDGLNGSPIDSMLIMESLGKALSLEPYLSSVIIGSSLINRFGTAEQKKQCLPLIGQGKLQISFAHTEPSSRYESNYVGLRASKKGNDWILDGNKSVVLNANTADYLIVSTRTNGDDYDRNGITVFLIPVSDQKGLQISSYSLQDGGRASEIRFNNLIVNDSALLGIEDKGILILETALNLANAALCSEAVGIMSALNEITLDYLKTRKQFGVPIGKFQALQHRMADMILMTEQSRSMAILAAVNQENEISENSIMKTSAAKAYICKAARLVGQEAVQLHGGMGVTNELNVGHYFKRLTAISQSFGDFDYHIDKVSHSILQ